jgi:hypothetical protein
MRVWGVDAKVNFWNPKLNSNPKSFQSLLIDIQNKICTFISFAKYSKYNQIKKDLFVMLMSISITWYVQNILQVIVRCT